MKTSNGNKLTPHEGGIEQSEAVDNLALLKIHSIQVNSDQMR